MSGPSQNQSLESATQSTPQPTHTTSNVVIYPSQEHHVTRGRYITSNDPRGYLPVYEYLIGNHPIMIDSDDGYILWTSICKALSKTKGDISKMMESDPDLVPRIRKVKGGHLKVQGTWIPREHALTLARKIAWNIRNDLVPLFGPDFPSTCLSPSDPGYQDILNPRRGGARRATWSRSDAPSVSVPAQSGAADGGPPSATQPWMPPARRDTGSSGFSESGAPGSRPIGYPTTSPTSPRGMYSSGVHHGSPPSHFNPYATGHPGVGQRYTSSTQSPSSTHMKEEPNELGSPYGYAPTQSYTTYGPSSTAPTSQGYGPTSSNYGYSAPQHSYRGHPHASSTGDYSQPTTPTHVGYPSDVSSTYNASQVVSEYSRQQPCDTYQSDQPNSDGYGSTYAAQPPQQAYQQPPYGPTSYVRSYSGDGGYGESSSAGPSTGSSRQEYQYSYGGSTGVSDVGRGYGQGSYGRHQGTDYQPATTQEYSEQGQGYGYQQQYPQQSYGGWKGE